MPNTVGMGMQHVTAANGLYQVGHYHPTASFGDETQFDLLHWITYSSSQSMNKTLKVSSAHIT